MFKVYMHYIVPASVLMPLSVSLFKYQLLNNSFRFLVGFLSFSALSSILLLIFAVVYHNNLIIIQSYTLGEFLFLSGFYYWQFNSTLMRRFIIVLVSLFMPFTLYFIIHYAGKIHQDDYTASVESLIMIALSMLLIIKNNTSSPGAWSKSPVNWFNTGILLYFSGAMFIFLFANINIDYNSLIYKIAWGMHATLLVILSTLFTVGFLKIKNE